VCLDTQGHDQITCCITSLPVLGRRNSLWAVALPARQQGADGCGWCRDRGSTTAQLPAHRLLGLGDLHLALFWGLLPCVELHRDSTHLTNKACVWTGKGCIDGLPGAHHATMALVAQAAAAAAAHLSSSSQWPTQMQHHEPGPQVVPCCCVGSWRCAAAHGTLLDT
jgi:hypothetical protein